VPLIVHWPARIRPGTSTALVSHTDFIASFAVLLGIELPGEVAPVSQNAMKALLGDDKKGNDYLIEEHFNHLALRNGYWNLIMRSPDQGDEEQVDQFEHYNLRTPDLTQELVSRFCKPS